MRGQAAVVRRKTPSHGGDSLRAGWSQGPLGHLRVRRPVWQRVSRDFENYEDPSLFCAVPIAALLAQRRWRSTRCYGRGAAPWVRLTTDRRSQGRLIRGGGLARRRGVWRPDTLRRPASRGLFYLMPRRHRRPLCPRTHTLSPLPSFVRFVPHCFCQAGSSLAGLFRENLRSPCMSVGGYPQWHAK